MRERGLKRNSHNDMIVFCSSLPMRERGLKHTTVESKSCTALVAPHAGAWIETLNCGSVFLLAGSLPMRERGLKHIE